MDIGTKITNWSEIKYEIKEANLEFFNLVDQLQPDSKFPIFILKFPYGELIGDELSQFIPIENKGILRLNDPNLPAEVVKHLGYGSSSSPMGMVLSKQFEWFVDLPHKKITLPIFVQNPGDFFSYTRVIDIKHNFNYSPMGVLSAISGARTTFLIPSIGCQIKLTKLRRELGVKLKHPTSMYEQFPFFKEILSSPELDQTWSSSLIYFSENWITNIKNNPDWIDVQKYFYKIFAQKAMYLKNLPYYQTAYSLLLESTNQKPNPYLFDTFKHLIDIMTGETPGFAPQINNNLLPVDVLQDVFLNCYGLKSIAPSIMAPGYFNVHLEKPEPIYYSLQFPTTRSFSPNSKKTSTMTAMRELKDICTDLFQELIKDNHFCSNTIIQHIAQNISLDFFHNSTDIDSVIDNVSTLIDSDNRFTYYYDRNINLSPAYDSKFFRGCLSIRSHS